MKRDAGEAPTSTYVFLLPWSIYSDVSFLVVFKCHLCRLSLFTADLFTTDSVVLLLARLYSSLESLIRVLLDSLSALNGKPLGHNSHDSRLQGPATADQCPSQMLFQKDLAVLSRVNDDRDVEAAVRC